MSALIKSTIDEVPYVKVADVIKRLENMQKKEYREWCFGASARISRIQSLIDDIKK